MTLSLAKPKTALTLYRPTAKGPEVLVTLL